MLVDEDRKKSLGSWMVHIRRWRSDSSVDQVYRALLQNVIIYIYVTHARLDILMIKACKSDAVCVIQRIHLSPFTFHPTSAENWLEMVLTNR